MTKTRTFLALAATAASLATASAAHATETPTQNVCVADITCTYVNYAGGKPANVVQRDGHVKSWTVTAGSFGNKVRLRVLRPTGHGALRFVRSTALKTIGDPFASFPYVNTYAANLKVRRGDVLALTSSDSGIYMTSAPATREIRYFNYDQAQHDGASGTPDRTAPALKMLLSAKVK